MQKPNDKLEKKNKVSGCFQAFLLGFLVMLIISLFSMLGNNGLFAVGGDYNIQQIPFYTHANDFIKTEGIGWDWMTDLGSDFIGSYSFYLFGSPFFFLSLIFSSDTIVYIMPFLIALKTGIASLTAYIYILRYVKKPAALMGAVMYALSGFQLFNVVFNHFHDVTALFPLLLLSFDMLVEEEKRGFFAFMTAVMAVTNYFFFFGQVVFIILYYIIRCITKSFRFSLKSFLSVALEAFIGVMISAVILMPSVLEVMANSRVSEIVSGTGAISYEDNTIIPKILQSLFIMPDLPSEAQLFQSESNPNNWASVSLYLPLFGVVGVVSYIVKNKKNWISKLLLLSLFIACIPLFNSLFFMFNATYYARWFYMPLLFMSIATVKTIEEEYDLMPGIKFQGIALIILAVVALLPGKVEYGTGDIEDAFNDSAEKMVETEMFALANIPDVFWQNLAISFFLLLIVFYFYKKKDEIKNISKKVTVVLLLSSLITSCIYIDNVSDYLEIKNYKKSAIEYVPTLEETDDFYRISDINDSTRNYHLMWNLNSAYMFHSIVPGSVNDFYKNVTGQDRMMVSSYKDKDYPVYGLLSVKYIFNGNTDDENQVEYERANIEGFELYDVQECVHIYENKHFVPMGYTYDYCISQSVLDDYLDKKYLQGEERARYKQLIMMRALVLEDEAVYEYSEFIPEISEEMLENLDNETYFSDCEDRKRYTCDDFIYDSEGFNTHISVDADTLVYFSVPVHDGWTAKVNGQTAEIITAHYGLSAVKVSAGENDIVFSYTTPGLKAGIVISLVGLFALVVYLIVLKITATKKSNEKVSEFSLKDIWNFLRDDKINGKAQKIFMIAVFTVSFLLPLVVIQFHENWRDEAQSWFIAKDLDFIGLLKNAKYEGHPVLWHLLLMPFAKLNMPYMVVNYISLALCTIGSFVLVFKTRITNILKISMVLSPFVLYHFSVISRSYALCYMIICLLVWLYPVRKEKAVIYGVLIALLFNTHILVAGVAGALVILEFTDIFVDFKKTKKINKKSLLGLMISCIGALIVFIILLSTMSANGEVKRNTDVVDAMMNMFDTYIPVLLASIFCSDTFPTAFAMIMIIISTIMIFLLIEKPKTLLLNTMGIGFIVAVLLYIYGANCQKSGLIYLVILLSVIVNNEEKKCRKDLHFSKGKQLNLNTSFILSITATIMLLIASAGNLRLSWRYDLAHVHSYSEKVAGYINDNVPKDSVIITVPDTVAASVKGYAEDYKYWSIFSDGELSFVEWTNDRKKQLNEFENEYFNLLSENDTDRFNKCLDYICSQTPFAENEEDLYLLVESQYMDFESVSKLAKNTKYELVFDYNNCSDDKEESIMDEQFYLFKLSA